MGDSEYERLIRKWAFKIADELGQLGRETQKSIRSGDLSDALEEARQVLILAEQEDLAEEARDLKVKVDMLRSELASASQAGRYITRVKLAPTREEVLDLARKIKNRMKWG